MERIQNIARRKVSAIQDAMPVTKAKKINYKRAVALIKQGKIVLKPRYPNRELYYADDFEDIFDVKGHHEYNGKDTYNQALCDKKTAPIYNESRRIQDQIMLGDATEALKLIEKFAKM